MTPRIFDPVTVDIWLCYGDGQAPLVDAYSLGRLLRYMLTGVTPDKSIMDALDEQSGMIDACFCLGLGKSSSKSKRRIVEPRCASPRSAEIMRRDQPRSCARPEMRQSCAERKLLQSHHVLGSAGT